MQTLESNLKVILEKNGSSLSTFLKEHKATNVSELSLGTIQLFCLQEHLNLTNLLSYNLAVNKQKLKDLKLLILDVDGVMTDGGMYFTENGDQFKKYNAKDGMAILAVKKKGIIDFGIISSGFKSQMVKSRADLLQIEHFYVGRDPKIDILKDWCQKLNIDFSQVGMIGDDINDMEIMKSIGFSAAPADAVPVIKAQVDLVLQMKGGEGCVREFIDNYILDTPLESN